MLGGLARRLPPCHPRVLEGDKPPETASFATWGGLFQGDSMGEWPSQTPPEVRFCHATPYTRPD